MRKINLTVISGKILFLFLAILFCQQSVNAQTVTIEGTGTTNNYLYSPIYSFNAAPRSLRIAYIYSQPLLSTMPSGSLITNLQFSRNTATGTLPAGNNLKLYIMNTSSNDWGTGALTWNISSATLVYDGDPAAIVGSTSGYKIFPLIAPFTYTGSNLAIFSEYSQVNGPAAIINWNYNTSGTQPGYSANQTKYTVNASATMPATLSTSTANHPNIKIDYTGGSGCTAPPTPGTSTVTPSTPVCLGTPISLNLSGNSTGSGQTYQWESSANLGGPYNPVSGVQPSPLYNTTAPSTSTYYRAAVTCSGNTQYSTPVQVIVSAGLPGGTYTINSAAPTGGANYQSFADAVAALSCGITGPIIFNVDAASGPYSEQVIITPVPGASATNTITFNGNGRTLQFLSTNTNERAVIKLNGADHITFDSLTITALGTTTTEYGFGVQLMNNADSNTINNCVININTTSTSTTNYAGIVMSASATSPITTGSVLCDYNTFSNNTITGGYYGITQVGSAAEANGNNNYINNIIRDFYLTGIHVNGSFNSLIEANDISRPTRTTVSTFNGIFFTGLSTSANITRNRIHDPFGGNTASTSEFNGVYFTGVVALSGLDNVVSNNLIYNTAGAGDLYGFYNANSDNVLYLHNTISLDGSGAGSTASDFTRGFYQITSAAGIQFRNNIITITRGGPSQKTAIYFATTITADTIYSNRNDFFLNSGAGTENVGFYNGAARATLIDWQTASGQDANSVSSDPIYTDVLSGNYKPTNASIDNLGSPVGITVDINEDPRSATTPDIGAYEFTPAVCTVPPVAGTATVSQNPICVNAPLQLRLTGNSVGLGQTYQWQFSTTIGGPYTNLGNPLTNPDTTIISSSTFYYRAAVTCSGNTTFSTPVLLTVDPALPAGTYTIDQTAPASPTNFISFNDAKAALACGIEGPVVINVEPGTGPYNEQLILDSIPGTSAVNTITFNGNGETITFNSTNTNERAVIKLNSTDYITFNDLVITATGTLTTEYGFAVQLIDNADFNTINNCTITLNTTSTSANYAGIVVSNSATSATTTGATRCDNNTFSNNTITGGYYGVTVVGLSTDQIQNNKVINNTLLEQYFYAIYVNGTNNTLVEGNNISRPTRTNSGTPFYGVALPGVSINAKISKNRIHNSHGGQLASVGDVYAVYLSTADATTGSPNIISNNAIYDLNGQGDIWALYNAGSSNAHYYHNTVSLDNTGSTSTLTTRGFYQTTLADGIMFKNNIITISRGGTGAKHAIYINTTTTVYTSDYNNFYIDPATTNSFVGYNGANQATLANWQTATSQDANSLSVDPLYTNMPAGDLKPNFAPLDNEGTPVGITTDILGVVRSAATPDIGAWEFNVLPCTSPPVPGTATATPNSGMCIGSEVQLSLSGNSSGAGQTYQWQYSTSAGGPWTNLGSAMLTPDTLINASGIFYYRVAVTCGGNTTFSTEVFVNTNPPFQAGTYTINNTQPTGGTNFNSFVEAVAAMECGINGPVIFNVAAGVYTEQVRMHSIAGTSNINTVTFQSANGIPSSVTLTFAITAAATNYVLKLDSASFITYKNMTITATGTVNARAVELANSASNDSLLNLLINVPTSTSTSNTIAGIVGTTLRGSNNVIKGNTITNGSAGIYIAGTSIAIPADRLVIDSNTVNGSYYYGIYTSNTKRVRVQKNIVNVAAPRNVTNYGIYATNSDTAYQYVSNVVDISNVASTTTYGMYFTSCDANGAEPGRIANNKITALAGNTGTLYGLYQTTSTNNNTVNNVIVINTSGASSYGLYSTAGGPNRYYNNSVNSLASSATNNYAAYFANTAGSGVDVRNNIFSHKGGGRALFVGSSSYVYSDYNMLYTTGTILVQSGTPAGTFATLAAWRAASSQDQNSIVYQPAFTSNSNLLPNNTDPQVWAIHGRGLQLPGNDYDFNNNPRPVTLTAGVPDLGAYEFVPTSTPPVLTATPATPAAGSTQTFMFGTDTVTKITWKSGFTAPSSVSVRRYSGVVPAGIAPTAKYMYFYTDVDVTTSSPLSYDIQQFYIDPWLGFVPREPMIRLGRTNASNAWIMDPLSRVDTVTNIISRDTLNFIDKFTGLTDSTVQPPPPPIYVQQLDSSNRGKRFWVAYGHHQGFSSNAQDMVLYLSAEQAANVQVKINGTTWVRNYSIPANTAIVSEIMPKAGLFDARITNEGKFDRGISIESDVPIAAYAHTYQGANSGAGMLLPVGVYGHEYISLNSVQYYAADCYSWFYVIADNDSTLVEITPVVTTRAGRPAGVPFTAYLNKGQVYNVMGTTSGATGTDLTGSKIRSIPNASGKCYPIAVFSGSSRTAICNTTNGDNIIQQVFPNQAWGRRFLTFATANSASNTAYYSNIWRVMVKDPTTVVRRNGVVLTGLVTPGNYYQFNTTGGDGPNGSSYIDADKPVLVAQYMVSSDGTGCPGITAPGGDGDPEMFYISPLEQGIKRAVFYNTDRSAINSNYINVIIPTAGLTSLTIDGGTAFTHVFPHPYLAGYTCIRHNLGDTSGQHRIQSDSAFTAITYGLGSVESYGYNAGTLVKNLNAVGTITNVFGSGASNPYTCKATPFRFRMRVNVKPDTIVWHFSQVQNLTPNTDVTQASPIPIDSSFVNGTWFYTYTVNQDYFFSATGTYVVPITIIHPSIEGCNSSLDLSLVVNVIPAPVTDFTVNFSGCITDVAQFNGSTITSNGVPVSQWSWNFGDNTTSTLQNPTKQWATPGVYNVNLRGVATDGCIGDTTKPVAVTSQPVVNITPDSLATCLGLNVIFSVQNPLAGAAYNWYTAATGGTLVHTGTSFTFTVAGPVSYYVEAFAGSGCISAIRKKVTVSILPNLAVPVVVLDSAGTNLVRFRWNPVPNATGYQVSVDNGSTWIIPSSGPTGLTHTITGLLPLQSATIIVRALGGCAEARSQPATGRALTDQVFIPNSFTPNGDGRNDVLQVYGYVIRELEFMIFNQWGEKIFETRNQATGWDGTYKGKLQPSGVYIYVCDIILNDGTKMQKKGSINLVR